LDKVLVLFDYETFHVTATRDLKLSVQEKGLDYLFEHLTKHGDISNNDIIVAANWDNFRSAKSWFNKKLIKLLDVTRKGSNVTDGYLIVSGLLHYEAVKSNDKFDHVVVVSGDGVNTGIVEHFLRCGSKVSVYTWKDCLSSALKINEDVTIHLFEDVFGVATNSHLKNGHFESFEVTNAEYAIINRVLKSKFDDLYFSRTVRDLVETKDIRYEFIDTTQKAKEFLNNCRDQGIFIPSKKLGSLGRDEITVFVLNPDNTKVKFVKENEQKNKLETSNT
jgi:hypothetical protein